MGDMQAAVDLGRDALWLAVKLALPVLAVGLLVGLAVSIVQAATQVQEQSVSFVPKMLAMAVTVILLLPWAAGSMVEYARQVIGGMARWMP
jgi:flagellar biosynthetic protein FliQ